MFPDLVHKLPCLLESVFAYDGNNNVQSFFSRGFDVRCESEVVQFLLKQQSHINRVIEIRGHVSLAEARQLPNNGMALSYQRSLAVAEALAERGVEWNRMRLMACGAGDPVVAPAYDDAGQRSNQRVEIISTDRAVREEPTQSTPLSAEPEPADTSTVPAGP